MSRPALEVADIFRDHGAAWRRANAGHVSLDQMKVMSAIERCRTAALGGHVARCEKCAHTLIAYNSCRNRHCPKCQGAAAKEWLAAREAELLPVPYFHVVHTLPGAIRDIAYQNKAVIYDLLFKAAAEATLTIAADPKRLGARIAISARRTRMRLPSGSSSSERNRSSNRPSPASTTVKRIWLSRRADESSRRRVEQLVGEGGFALVTGAPGTGKSVTLRILAERTRCVG